MGNDDNFTLNSLHCLKCNSKLMNNEDLFLYRPVSSESHLAVKYEKTDSLLNPPESKTLKVSPIPTAASSSSSFRVADVKCFECEELVGSLIKCGPNQEALICISMKSTYNLLPDGTRLTNASAAGSNRRKQLLEASMMVQVRGVTEFYGPEFRAQKSQALLGPLRHPTIEDLNRVDLSVLIKDKPRSYQMECFCISALFSSIIQIPTGSGKTLISVMLAVLYKQLNPHRMIWFLTDRVPLVFQQARYIEEQTSLTVLPLAGEIQTALKPTQIVKYDVLVCTVQSLINMLINGQLRPEDASLVVFDEVHHAVKNHPYVIFIETFLSKFKGEDRPRLLGLTASPASGNPIQMKLQLSELKSLCRAQFYTPCIYRQDLEATVNRPTTNFIPIDLERVESDLSRTLFEAIRELFRVEKLLPCSNIDDVRISLRILSEKAATRLELSSVIHRIHRYITAMEMTSILGSKYSSKYLIESLNDSKKTCELTPKEAEIMSVCESSAQAVSPKALALCKLINSIDLNASPDTRMIVFVETKRTARWLAAFLKENLSSCEWNPTAFIGQSSNSIDGMTWNDEQKPLLALFRSGLIKLLVATSVLQEGLDVAECNRIVLFDRTWSLKAFLQSRGRARAQNSEYTIICSPEDESFYRDLANQESILTKMILDDIVGTDVLCLEMVMTMIHLNVKYKGVDFGGSKAEIYESSFGEFNQGLIDVVEEEECALSLIVHLAQEVQEIVGSESDLAFRVASIQCQPDHLYFFSGQTEHQIELEISNVLLKGVNKSWIQLVENIFDPLLKSKFDESGLLELDANFVKEVILDRYETGRPLGNYSLQMQKFSAGYFESPSSFIECASQHHSFTPNLSVIKLEAFSPSSFNILFQESPDCTYRIEIRFDSIDAFCLLSRTFTDDAEDANFCLALPLKCPPLLYASKDLISQFDIESGLDKFNWDRLPAGSFSSRLSDVFSHCPVIKLDLLLNPSSSKKLFQALSNVGSCIFYSSGLKVQSFPEYHSMWSSKVGSVSRTLDFESQYRLKSFISETWSSTSCRLSTDWLLEICKYPDFVLKQIKSEVKILKFIDLNEYFGSRHSLNAYEDLSRSIESSENLDLIKSVTWTPSRLLFNTPTAMISNRVLREFGSENFIKVQFRDEDLSKLSMISSGKASIDQILDLGLRKILEEGIRIGERRFRFLAMSASQLRNHGCWFVDEGLGVERVRGWLGSFDSIKNVAKYVARLGQSFSSSLPTVTVPAFDLIPDWESNGFCFSDGCGMISIALAKQIAEILKLDAVPSAFQIRFAGFKGVVAVNPESSAPLSLRPSMKKYESPLRILDVLNVSQAFPCYLNRQIIMILSALGIPDSAFESLQFQHLKSLHEMFHSTSKSLNFDKFHLANVSAQDPFVHSLQSATFQQQMNDLLFKSRIFVPNGRILMGVIDESGTLKEDEVFCQIDDLNLSATVIEGPVILAKNPCMHPGDVRVLKAVKNPLLESYSRNVIVFSRHGPRPIPNMCSGSDLDGDLYFVSWDQSLVPSLVDEPMAYEGLPASNNSSPISDQDLRDFMLFFIKNDQLGSIANTHVAFADRLEEGVRDPACKSLAKLFSLAVDFPKTGFVARLPKEVRIEKYPDFMMKTDKPSYTSQRIIGKLFREVRIISANLNYGGSNSGASIDWNRLRSGYEVFTGLARRMYERFAVEVAKILIQYGLTKESHLIVNCSAEISDPDIMEPAKMAYNHLINVFKIEFDSITSNDSTKIDALADACYYVTYSEPLKPAGLLEPVLSFPWIFKTNSLNRNIPADNLGLSEMIGKSFETWFSNEYEGLMEYLSTNFVLINHIISAIDDNSDMKFCIQEYLLTNRLVIKHNWRNEDEMKLLQQFPDAKVIRNESTTCVQLKELQISFTESPDDFSQSFMNRDDYLLGLIAQRVNEPAINGFNFDKIERAPFENLIDLILIPEALQSWSFWIQSAGENFFINASELLLNRLTQLIELNGENRTKLMKIYFTLLKSLDLNTAISSSGLLETSTIYLKSSLKYLMKNPKIFQRVTSHDKTRGFYVQGAAKLIFSGSSNDNDLLWFRIYDGPRRLAHLSKVCYRLSLKSSSIIGGDQTPHQKSFAFNEFWAHMHKQMNLLHKFGQGENFGKLQFSLKFGRVYATEIPNMFIETPNIQIWLARLALEKTFKGSKTSRFSDKSSEDIELTGLKAVPKNDSSIQESVSSSRVTQSLQSLLDSLNKDSREEDDVEESSSKKKNNIKKKKLFGKISTNFESYASEEFAMKLMKAFGGQFEEESILNVSLVCYDESSNTNASFSLTYNEAGELIKISRRPLKWAIIDVVGSEKSFDFRFSISTRISANPEKLKSSIFSAGILESDHRSELKVKEAFKANSTIYVQLQDNHFKSLQNGLILQVKRVKEAFGVDPTSGSFVFSQEKWEIEVKSEIETDWEDSIANHQKRNEVIGNLWGISQNISSLN